MKEYIVEYQTEQVGNGTMFYGGKVTGELIRCKDCKNREAKNGFCKGRGWPMQLVPDDDFCSKAAPKRKGKENQ